MPAADSRQARLHPKKLIVRTFSLPRKRADVRDPLAGKAGPIPNALPPRPHAPVKPLRARQIKRQAQREAGLAWLKATWPSLFGKQPKPLAIGVGPEITARAGKAGLKPFEIGGALFSWTNSRGYLAAIAAEGAMRWNLAGTAVEFVAGEHQAAARERIQAAARAHVAKMHGRDAAPFTLSAPARRREANDNEAGDRVIEAILRDELPPFGADQ